MDLFELSQKTVDAALRQNRIGTPVSVRIIAHATVDHGRVESRLARAIVAAGGWLRSLPTRLLARGSVESGQITVQLKYQGGQSALVSTGSPGISAPFVDVVIAGNHGVLSWESDRSAPAVRAPGNASSGDEISTDARQILRAVRASLAARRPVDFVTAEAIGPASIATAHSTSSAPPADNAVLKTPPPKRTQKPPYGVLLVAGGFTHQEMYGPGFQEDSRCRLIGLADEENVSPRRKKLNAQLAESLRIPLLPNLDEALARADVNIVSVCAEPDRRAPLTIRCADAGKHVYMDKPLATSMADADRIVAALRRGQSIHQMFSLVHTNVAARTRALLDAGTLGELTAIHCDAFFAKGIAGTANLGKPRIETARPENFETIDSKRELHNVGVYSLVQIAWLLRRPVRSVFATTANYFFEEHQKNDMEDFAQLSLEFEGGLVATVCAGRTGWRSHPMSGLNRMVFVGANGTACVDAFCPRVEVWANEDAWPLPRRHPEDPMGFWVSSMKEVGVTPKRAWITPVDATTDVRYFLDCIEHGRASDVPAELAATALEVILAAYQSAATGQVVALPLVRA